jgi:hypothetical protein
MKNKFLLTMVCLLGLSLLIAGSASAVTIGFSSVDNAFITFNGTDTAGGIGTFSFIPGTDPFTSATADFRITSSTILGAVGDDATITTPMGGFLINNDLVGNKASVSRTGTLQIFDHFGGSLTGILAWISVETTGATGGLNNDLLANLTGISYTPVGFNVDQALLALAQALSADGNLTFQTLGKSMGGPNGITSVDGITLSSTYSGEFSSVPIPATALLLGSGLLGLVGLGGRRRKQ